MASLNLTPEELKAVGITLDYAPVLDIHTNPENPVIGDRALAEDAEMVARLGAAIIRGLEDHGVAACGKHFPGHGDTAHDAVAFEGLDCGGDVGCGNPGDGNHLDCYL